MDDVAAAGRSEKGARVGKMGAAKEENRKSAGESAMSGGRDRSSESEQP